MLAHIRGDILKRLNILSVLFLISICTSNGQNVPDSSRINLGFPVYSQYLQNGLVINPAYTGTREVLSAFLSYRMQWMGTRGSPLLQSISFHSPLKNDKVALGLMAQFMKYGVTKSTSIFADYAYHIKLKKGKLSFGLKAGVDLSNTDYTGLILNDPDDPVFKTNDKALVLPNVGTGIYYLLRQVLCRPFNSVIPELPEDKQMDQLSRITVLASMISCSLPAH